MPCFGRPRAEDFFPTTRTDDDDDDTSGYCTKNSHYKTRFALATPKPSSGVNGVCFVEHSRGSQNVAHPFGKYSRCAHAYTTPRHTHTHENIMPCMVNLGGGGSIMCSSCSPPGEKQITRRSLALRVFFFFCQGVPTTQYYISGHLL